jgi:hypothetical protein
VIDTSVVGVYPVVQLKVSWNIYNAKTMDTALVTSMRRGVPAGSESITGHKHSFIEFVLYLEER